MSLHLHRAASISFLLMTCMLASRTGVAGEAVVHRAGESFDAAPFGAVIRDEGGLTYGVQWSDPRKIRRVVAAFEGTSPADLRIQYWHGTWDGGADRIAAESDAGGVGWEAMDDWTNGKWRDADAQASTESGKITFRFAPAGAKEFPGLGSPGVQYRKTLAIRIVSKSPLPAVARFAAFTDSVCRPIRARILWGRPAEPALLNAGTGGRIEIYNGYIEAVRAIGELHMEGAAAWSQTPGEGGVEADLLMAVDPTDARYDRTVVTLRGQREFSFANEDVLRGERILVEDLGALVVRGDDATTLEECRAQRREFPGRRIYDRVTAEPEQSLARAWKDMPLKRPLAFVHGLPGNRNAMRQDADGGVLITSNAHWFARPHSDKDTKRKEWEGDAIRFRFGFPEERPGERELRDGYLPRLRTTWQAGPIQYEQSTILDKLDGSLETVALDDPTLLLMRVRFVNTSGSEKGQAILNLGTHQETHEKLFCEGDRVLGMWKEQPRFRYLVKTGGRGTLTNGESGVRYALPLAPGEAHEVFLLIPSITLSTKEEIDALRKRDFEADAGRICRFWEELTARGTVLETPEPWLNGFYKAHVRHLLVNSYKEIGSDRLHAHVGTFAYGVYPDESAMMISDLDRRGYHDEARRCLDSFLEYQGTVQMPGNFKSTQGLFYGSGGHDTGGYNKSHAWVMWLMAEHWRMTRDRAWMDRAAPKLVGACDWVTRERKATMEAGPGGVRPLEYGFLPTGSLEDVTDYWHWMVTNVCTVWGFESLAGALADRGHPEAARLQAEAKAFREDVLRGLNEARVQAPVVRLRDRTWVPKYPSRLFERGRSHGWLRETLEGSIHLLITGLIDPHAPQARWIIDDFEDNLYISSAYGYDIPAFGSFWFSRGGFSMQANLLGGPLVYLYRDDVKHFLRGYFNSLASAFYPDIKMCNEHSLPELGYPAGDHYKSSDEAQSTYWLRLMFIREQGRELYLGQAIPRDWLKPGRGARMERAPTHFGAMSLRFEPASENEIGVTIDPPSRNAPEIIYVRVRHPTEKPIRSVTLNGAAYEKFDARREWVILPGRLEGTQKVVVRY